MAVSSEIRKTGIYIGDGATSRYPFKYKVLSVEYISVVVSDGSGEDKELAHGRDYEAVVARNQDIEPGGYIDLKKPLPIGHRLVIVSNQDYLQPTVLTNHGGFYPTVLNAALDRLTIQIQQLSENVERSLKVGVITPENVSLNLPTPYPNKGLAWNAEGTGLTNTDFHEQAAASAERAADAVRQAENEVKKVSAVLSGLKTVPTFASIDLLRQAVKGDSPAAIVSSYHEGKPGGGGIFIADARDKSTADNGGTVIVAADGTRWKRQIEGGRVTLADFGILPDGTDVGAAINKAFEACAGSYLLVADAGTYLTSVELKAPTGLRFSGAGMYRTLIKAAPSLPAIANLLTNKSNNYETRTAYDHSIHIADIAFDADWRGRYAIGTPINNQACGVKFSAVRLSSLINVRVINAALHCFDICADQYVDTGNVADNAANQSEQVLLRGCVAGNPYRDDGFTTHNSRNITFEDCIALFDGSVSALGNTQQGFEADEGSTGVAFRNCVAKGYHCGYQSKGHQTTKPAEQIVFENCTAEKCAIGFMASTGSNPQNKPGYVPQGVRFLGCTARALAGNTHRAIPAALWIYGADSVYVESFHNYSPANIVIEQGAGYVNLGHIVFAEKVGTAAAGCIEIRGTAGKNSSTTIYGFKTAVSQALPVLVKDDANAVLAIDGMIANGENNEAAVKLKRNPRDRITGLRVTGYNNVSVFLMGDNIPLKGYCILDAYNKTYLFGNTTNTLPAPRGTVITNPIGSQYVQKSDNGLQPNWKLVIDAS